MKDVIDIGLDQMPAEALQRIVDHVDAGKPMYLAGGLVGPDGST